MKTEDWISIITPKVLLIGENSTLQWSDEVIEYVLFLDYYFRKKPYDLGERSRWSEAKATFDYIRDITAEFCRPEQLYATNLSMDLLPRPPKGKRIFIPEKSARLGMQHIKNVLRDNPSIEYVFVMGMQSNYYLQKLGFYAADEKYIAGAQPRNIGLENDPPYYQPVNGKVFRTICGRFFDIPNSSAKLVPILPTKDYPLKEDNIRIYQELYDMIRKKFE